ncbi:hypothetical protein [Kineosporia babensis]|uniref:Secreted protein n=1 Tax=Kineosporia babensis TaxID=499548 RepID=A0A9X1T0H4_9ACTN|nr:hypothetical protein [Kineosporia babensis]MCD5312733.1 hypothetical protein [Kineosporia babensis]
MRTKLKTLTLGTVAGLVAGVCFPAAASAAGDTDPLFYSGVIRVEADGAQLRAAAVPETPVSVEYWPDAKIGEAIEPQVLATTTTDGSGKYNLRLDPDDTKVQKALAKNGDWLNVVLRYGEGTSGDFTNIAQRWNGKTWGDPKRPDTAPGKQHVSTIENAPGTSRISAAARPKCYWYVTGKPKAYTKIAEYHSSAKTSGSWEYGQTADSNVEVGLKPSGKGWEINGTSQVATVKGASVRVDEGRGRKGYYATTRMQYQEVRLDTKPAGSSTSTTCGAPWFGLKVGTKMVTAKQWLGGTAKTGDVKKYTCAQAPQKYNDVNMLKGTTFVTTDAKASKLGGAAVVGGASLGATSGYSNNVKLTLTWHKKGKVCGGNAAPVDANTIYVD